MTEPTMLSAPGDSGAPAAQHLTGEFSEPPPEGQKGAEWRTWAIAGVAAVAIVVVGFMFLGGGGDGDAAGVAAADGANTEGGFPSGGGFPGGSGANGEVIGIEGTALTVEVPSDMSGGTSTMTVEAAADTEIVETVAGSTDDLGVGDEITAIGDESDGVIAATTITEGGGAGGMARGGFPGGSPPEGFEPPEDIEPGQGPGGQGRGGGQGPGGAGGFVSGSIVSIDGTMLMLETDDGEATVEVGDDTSVVVTQGRSFGDIEVGDSVQAIGETEGSVVAASRIQIGSLGFGRGDPGGGFAPVPGDDTTTG